MKTKEFIREELKITREIEFARVHRTSKKGGRARPRPIVAKFERYKDREDVKHTGWKLLKFVKEARANTLTTGIEEGTPLIGGHQMNPKFVNIGIGEQYPQEIYQRRKEQMPIFKNAVYNKQRVRFVLDKLYING